MLVQIFAALAALQVTRVFAISNITFYSDSECASEPIAEHTGDVYGTCAQISATFGSFMVTELDQTCAVTIYANDAEYCSSSTLSLANFGKCYTNTTVGWFSVDCGNSSVAATASYSSVVPTGSSSTTNGNTSDDSLSTGAKAGIGIGVSLGSITIIAAIIFLALRRRRAWRKQQGLISHEAGGDEVPPPLPRKVAEMYTLGTENEKKDSRMGGAGASELWGNSHGVVEAPTENEVQKSPQEMDASAGRERRYELEGSEIPSYEKEDKAKFDTVSAPSS